MLLAVASSPVLDDEAFDDEAFDDVVPPAPVVSAPLLEQPQKAELASNKELPTKIQVLERMIRPL